MKCHHLLSDNDQVDHMLFSDSIVAPSAVFVSTDEFDANSMSLQSWFPRASELRRSEYDCRMNHSQFAYPPVG